MNGLKGTGRGISVDIGAAFLSLRDELGQTMAGQLLPHPPVLVMVKVVTIASYINSDHAEYYQMGKLIAGANKNIQCTSTRAERL